MPRLQLNKKILKFGKKISDIKKIKQDFIFNNEKLLKSQVRKGNLYSKQPRRTVCKVCEKKLLGKKIFIRSLKYVQCSSCSHLNGVYQDTSDFVKKIYSSKAVNYSKKYFEKNKKDYVNRVNNIYVPKVDFLKSNIKNYKNLKVLDVGTGSGYFISALNKKNITNFLGIEVSEEQVNYGKKMLSSQKINSNKISHIPFYKLENFLKNYKDYNCASFIGVIEHLQEMKKIVRLVTKNKNCNLIYISVPLYSLTAVIESSFPSIFNRHLGGSHTHLFTEKSLKFFFKTLNFVSHSEWWFGQDYNDLYRSMLVTSDKMKNSSATKILNNFGELIDDFQIILDKNKLSSEVHMLFKRKK